MDGPFFFGSNFFLLMTSLIYLVIVVFLIMLAYRFVRAHESISDSLREIAETGRNESGHPL